MHPLATLTLVLAVLAPPCLSQAQTAAAPIITLDGTTLTLQLVASGLDAPLFLTSPPGDPRLFVVEQAGRVRILTDDAAAAPFLDIAAQISSGGERGLLGLAFHPDYAANGRFFLYYTDPQGDITLASMRAASAPDRADPASLQVLLTIGHRQAANHNGGWIGFGPDGLLYAGVGDGGGAGDRRGNAQHRARLLGKILRLDVDSGTPYAIPPGNPFAAGGGAPEIFALGLRNPWRNAFDGTSLYIADVGQNGWEEVNVVSTADGGVNLGWNRMEGADCFRATACDQTGLTLPVHAYDHDTGCSITGGYVYRGAALPALQGRYFFGDFCTGALMSLRYAKGQASDITTTPGSLGTLTSFGQDSTGEIYILTAEGTVSRLIAAP